LIPDKIRHSLVVNPYQNLSLPLFSYMVTMLLLWITRFMIGTLFYRPNAYNMKK